LARRMYSVYLDLVLATALSVAAIYYITPPGGPSARDLALFVAGVAAVTAAHEALHYALAKWYGANPRVSFAPRIASIALEYTGLRWDQLVVVALVPPAAVQLACTAVAAAVGSFAAWATAIYHAAASSADVLGAASAVLKYRGCTFSSYRRGRGVRVVVECPDGRRVETEA